MQTRRSAPACYSQKPVRQIFTAEEDARLKRLVSCHGETQWGLIADQMGNRTPRQCRERFRNYLAPELSYSPWTDSDDNLLRQKVGEFGQKWAKIAAFFEGRSDVSIKNHWTSLTAKKGKSIGSDPFPFANEEPSPPPPPPQPEPEAVESPVQGPSAIDRIWQTAGYRPDLRETDPRVATGLEDRFRNFGGKVW
jgi:hypothetical protein